MTEADMLYDERDRSLARQELLEAFASGMGGPACAPMPGTLLEMLEIAAMERRWRSDPAPAEVSAESRAPLTSPRIGSRMIAWLRRAGEAIVNVGGRFRAGSDARRLPV
jgi:hypothetical protein